MNRFEKPWINVDAYGDPDIRHDLGVYPWPFEDNSVDRIAAWHVFEHLDDWWGAFLECARILKPGGILEMRVPDESSSTALTYRDHKHVFGINSFHGISGTDAGTNAWAEDQGHIPMRMSHYVQVPFKNYNWMTYAPWLIGWCARHMRNFIHEQRFQFTKMETA